MRVVRAEPLSVRGTTSHAFCAWWRLTQHLSFPMDTFENSQSDECSPLAPKGVEVALNNPLEPVSFSGTYCVTISLHAASAAQATQIVCCNLDPRCQLDAVVLDSQHQSTALQESIRGPRRSGAENAAVRARMQFQQFDLTSKGYLEGDSTDPERWQK